MQYIVKKIEQGFKFYIKDCNLEERALSIEVDPELAKKFDSKAAAAAWMKSNKFDKTFSIHEFPAPDEIHP